MTRRRPSDTPAATLGSTTENPSNNSITQPSDTPSTLTEDWTARYNITPVLIETFVETPRYTGAVYRASGWIQVGATQGRGRYDREKLYDKPRKDVWLRPLRRDWKRTLNR